MNDIDYDIRVLFAKYGIPAVQASLGRILRADYEYLQNYFINQGNTNENTNSNPITQDKKEKKIVKKKNKDKQEQEKQADNESIVSAASAADLIDHLVEEQMFTGQHVSPHTPVIVQKLQSDEPIDEKPKHMTLAEQKAWQKDQEAKKRMELEEAGIDPASLLTRENMERWVGIEKKGYAYIARTLVGLPESAIANACENFGILSEAAKRRKAILAGRANAKFGRGRGR